MNENNNLVEGNIFSSLVKLALPIMGTSLFQMAYNMTDMMWLGRTGSDAVAAAGTAGFFAWFGMAFIMLSKIGAEVGVAQSVGKNNMKAGKKYVANAIQLNVILGLLYAVMLFIFRNQLISFFNIENTSVVNMAVSYLSIIAIGMNFYFINPVLTGIFNGYGDSKTPFIINFIGLGCNIILDPLLIMGLGPFPALGVKGAAIATIISQFVVTMAFVFIIKVRKNKAQLFSGIKVFLLPKEEYIKHITRLGAPVAIQSGLFTIFAMVIARIVAGWGEIPMAVQKVGSQIEAISWMTAGGFSTALSTFVGQNYGAKKWDRIYKGYFAAISIVGIVGIAASCLLIFAARPIFAIFIPDEEAIKYGVVYLRILGLSQFFMCIEITTGGAFNGLGKTIPPSVVSIVFNALRIPGAIILSSTALLGLNGIWWSISMSSVFKGIILTTWFIILISRHPYIKANKENKLSYKEM